MKEAMLSYTLLNVQLMFSEPAINATLVLLI